MIINNYEVDFEEEGPELRMISGVRGIRALRVQREYLPQATENTNPQVLASGGNMFGKYEESKN